MMKRIFLLALTILAITTPADGAPKKPLVVGAGGQAQPIQGSDTIQLPAATSANASINVPHGSAPSSPVNGDVWSTTNGLYSRVNGKTVPVSSNVIDVTAYGAVGDNSTDDSTAIKAAFAAVPATGHVTVRFPPAKSAAYKYCPGGSAEILITAPNVTIEGSGWASKILTCQTSGDFLHFVRGASTNIPGVQVKNLAVYATGANPTSGALIHCEDCNNFRIEGVDLSAYYGGLFLDGAVHGVVDANIVSDANFTSLAIGSYLLKVAKSTYGTLPAEIHVAKADWRGQNGNNYLDYGVLITGTDGVWFDDLHVGFSRYGIALLPASNRTQLTSVIVRNGYLDTVSINGLYVAQPSGSYAADFGAHDLHFANAFSSGADMIKWYLTTSGQKLWSNIYLGWALQPGQNGINIGLGNKIAILPGWHIQSPGFTAAIGCGAAGTCNGIVVNGASSDIDIGTGVVEKFSATNVNCALQVTTSVTNWRSDTIRYKGMTSGLCDTSSTANKSAGSILAW